MSIATERSIVAPLGLALALGLAFLPVRGPRADYLSIRDGTPPELRERANPIEVEAEDLSRAASLYQENCTLCHGPKGDGRGPVGRTLHPRPMDFSDAELMAKVRDGELYYAITSGSHGTAMPAFGDRFEETDVWRLVAYLRGFSRKDAERPMGEAGPTGE